MNHHHANVENSQIPLGNNEENILIDSHNRKIDYLRLAITDRCNLRCRYCRPEKGIPFIPHSEILSLEELERIVRITCEMGISKIRVTGGEPFSRKGCLFFLKRLKRVKGVKHLHITTNGVKTFRYLDELAEIGIDGINLSLDTLDQKTFLEITRRDYLDSVLQTLHAAIALKIPLKINSVVLENTTNAEILRLSELAKIFPITLRFIERMPFSGTQRNETIKNDDLTKRLKQIFPLLQETKINKPTTARIFTLTDFKGKLGLIQGHSRFFCKSCNKLRITPAGILKTCLYDNGVLDLKQMLRSDADDLEIKTAILVCVNKRFQNGHEAEKSSSRITEPSMAEIGG